MRSSENGESTRVHDMTRPRVIELEETTRLDTSSAESYGALTRLFSRGEQGRPGMFTPEYADEVSRRLVAISYDPAVDYLLLAGPIVALAAAVSRITAEYGQLNALTYFMPSRQYVLVTLGLRRDSVTV